MKLTCKLCKGQDFSHKDGVIVCNNCKCEYSINEAKKMISNNNTSVTPPQPQNTYNNNEHNLQSQDIVTKDHDKTPQIGCAILVVLILLFVFLMGIVIIEPFDNNNKNFKQQIAEIIKEKPSVTAQETLIGIDFLIECKDDYSYVELEVRLLDNNDNIIDVVTLTGSNYKKGNTYTLSYYYEDLSSLINALKSNRVTYKITKYE